MATLLISFINKSPKYGMILVITIASFVRYVFSLIRGFLSLLYSSKNSLNVISTVPACCDRNSFPNLRLPFFVENPLFFLYSFSPFSIHITELAVPSAVFIFTSICTHFYTSFLTSFP